MTPRFSIVTPVYDPPEDALRAAIRSVIDQSFGDWELILVDDASPAPHVLEVLHEARAADPRIVVVERPANGGIVAASNDGLDRARGEWIVLFDHDDLLVFDALAKVESALRADEEIDYLYTDEDKIDEHGRLSQAFYKPDWSPERLRSQNYCCHISALRRSIVEEVGGFRDGFDGSQDHDLVLRVTERARKVHHIPEVLYHWRILPTSAAASAEAKPYAVEAGRRAVQEHCDRVGIPAEVEAQFPPGNYRVRRRVQGDPLVSIVIPTRGSKGRVWGVERYYVLEAVRSVVEQATYDNYELVVVADEPTPDVVVRGLEQLAGDRLKLVWYDRPFNFAEKMNVGRISASGEVLLLLNDDVEVVTPDFIEVLVALAQEPGVGSAGAKLLYSDGTLQHAGHYYNGDCFHAFAGWDSSFPGPHSMLVINRECIGVTAACMAIRTDVWDDVGGMCDEFFASFNDVDLALKLRESGYRTVWTPQAVLHHFESVTRNPTVSQSEVDLLHHRWGPWLSNDPYGNPNLEPKRQDWVPRGAR
jgi:glycosyltransferase involved in cell wall biosynthesis